MSKEWFHICEFLVDSNRELIDMADILAALDEVLFTEEHEFIAKYAKNLRAQYYAKPNHPLMLASVYGQMNKKRAIEYMLRFK